MDEEVTILFPAPLPIDEAIAQAKASQQSEPEAPAEEPAPEEPA
jgi:hypothetical protein